VPFTSLVLVDKVMMKVGLKKYNQVTEMAVSAPRTLGATKAPERVYVTCDKAAHSGAAKKAETCPCPG